MAKLTKNFSSEEFACGCGCNSSGKMSPTFIDQLQKLRDIYGPMIINSGYRCSEYNEAVSGSKSSMHLRGIAADVSVTDSTKRHRFAKAALDLGLTIIIYKNFVHVDARASGPKLIVV